MTMQNVADLLRPVPEFPHDGILFWDILPLLRSPEAMDFCITMLAEHYAEMKIDVVAGLETRGFIFAEKLASKLGVSFEPVRKAGKLPPPTEKISYKLEYGEATIEMADDNFLQGKHVLVVDDLLATGGTAEAAGRLIEKLGGIIAGFAFISEIPNLGGRGKLYMHPVHSLISIIDDTLCVDTEYCSDVFARDVHTGALVLVERLTFPAGLAMPGGRIKQHESAFSAARRELYEETGYRLKALAYGWTLSGLTRDERGVKVSTVFDCIAEPDKEHGVKDEEGGTTVVFVNTPAELPDAGAFAFDHGSHVHRVWPEIEAKEEAIRLEKSA